MRFNFHGVALLFTTVSVGLSLASPQAIAASDSSFFTILGSSFLAKQSNSLGTSISDGSRNMGLGIAMEAPDALSAEAEPNIGAVKFPFKARIGFSLGVHYLLRRYEHQVDASNTTKKSGVHIPLMMRLWLGTPITLGLGPYYTTSIGGDLPGLDRDDFGIVSALRMNLFPMAPIGFTLEARYLLGLTNLSSSGSIKTRDVVWLVGIRFDRVK